MCEQLWSRVGPVRYLLHCVVTTLRAARAARRAARHTGADRLQNISVHWVLAVYWGRPHRKFAVQQYTVLLGDTRLGGQGINDRSARQHDKLSSRRVVSGYQLKIPFIHTSYCVLTGLHCIVLSLLLILVPSVGQPAGEGAGAA